jgi:hypothetical protein
VLKKIAYIIAAMVLVALVYFQSIEIINANKAKSVIEPYTYFLFKSGEGNHVTYRAVNGRTRRVELENSDPVTLIESALARTPTNSKIIFGGPGGWYLERTLTIKGKLNGNPADEDKGFQEVIIDASQIEFVMDGDKARDFIIIDSILGCQINFGVIAANPDEGYSALVVKPILQSQYSGVRGASWSNIKAQIIQGSGSGNGLYLDSSENNSSIQYMRIDIGSISGFQKNVIIYPGNNYIFGNEIKITRNIVVPGGIGIQVGTEPTDRLYNNRYVTGVSSIGGIGLDIWGSYGQYDLSVTEGDEGKIIVFEPGAINNVVNANSMFGFIGYTDNSGNATTNKIIGWTP